MGTVQSLIKDSLSSDTAEQLRADLSSAQAAHTAAVAAWTEDESASRWKIAEDLEREVKQLTVRLARAERIEAEAAERAAADRCAKELADLDAKAVRLNEHTAFVETERRAIIALAQALVQHYVAIMAGSDAYQRGLRDLQEHAARLQVPTPTLDDSAPRAANQMVRYIQREVMKQHVADGRHDYTTCQRAAALVEGTFS